VDERNIGKVDIVELERMVRKHIKDSELSHMDAVFSLLQAFIVTFSLLEREMTLDRLEAEINKMPEMARDFIVFALELSDIVTDCVDQGEEEDNA
jgi:hypothetical protein